MYQNGDGRFQSFYFQQEKTIDISGYQSMRMVYAYFEDDAASNILIIKNDDQLYYQVNDSLHIPIQLNDYFKNQIKTGNSNTEILTAEDATLYFAQDSINGKIVVNNLSLSNYKKLKINNLNGALFLK